MLLITLLHFLIMTNLVCQLGKIMRRVLLNIFEKDNKF